ncbi:hypothetical protein [Clostridium estertheticum]|uniref:hypothetical protein n=1 Tax=Clostridium estertheticum TaxID=238834 RepID=UPI001CF45E95|nr:hypothetical protein [Clostridium estertheticum]MCB2354367.1 hypothetical protein [Clostridium estertheticum]WAG42514.1 hypothetical protein LL065_07530 [Clostridium estertheticum]
MKSKVGLLKKINSGKNLIHTLIFILIIAIFSILLMDLCLKKIQAPFEIFSVLGDLYYKVCLSYIASFIFYTVTVHIPKQRKRISVHRYLNNKIGSIHCIERDLLNVVINGSVLRGGLADENLDKLIKEKLETICRNINPQNQIVLVSTMGVVKFDNWFQLLNFMHNQIKSDINDLLFFQECLDGESVSLLTNIEDCFSQHINRMRGNALGNEDMSGYSSSLWNLHTDAKNLINSFHNNSRKISHKYDENFIANQKKY